MDSIIPNNEETTALSYNYFLFKTRLERKLSIRKFAKLLKIRPFRYKLIERGYLKPNDKQVASISEVLGVDFQKNLEGFNGYPTELPEKKQHPVSAFLYRAMGTLCVRIFLALLALASISFFVVSFFQIDAYTNNVQKLYPETAITMRDKIAEKGSTGFSLISFASYPYISSDLETEDNGDQKIAIISVSRHDTPTFNFHYREILWRADYRITFSFLSYYIDGTVSYTVECMSYAQGKNTVAYAYVSDGKIEVMALTDSAEVEEIVKAEAEKNNFRADFNNLIKDRLDLDIDFVDDIIKPIYELQSESTVKVLIWEVVHWGTLVLGAVSLFGLIFALIYGQKSTKVRIQFHHGDELLGFQDIGREPKKDIRLVPFLPETVLEIIGIIIVAIGSLRAVYLSSSLISYSSEIIEVASTFMSILMLGMFLLYFIDFDLFMDDRRVLRNVVLYLLVFLVLYYLESSILVTIENSETILSSFVNLFMIPNPFGSVTCYFALMVFLFFTPKFIKTKRGLIVFRSLGILPVAYLAVAFCIVNGETLFGWEPLSIWTKHFFVGERLPYSILAVSYLVGLFFLRLFYKRRYGEENAQRLFMGNRYLFIKNIMTCVIVLIVWIFDMANSTNAALNKVGVGTNGGLIFLVPLLLFYHPHKGPRNLAVDYFTLFFYGLALSYAYVIAAIVGLAGLVL